MRPIYSSLKVQSFIWDKAFDSGALGTYSTGINIPLTAIVTDVDLNVLTGIVGGAAGTFDMSWAGNVPFISFGNLVPVSALSFGPIALHATNTDPLVRLIIATNTFTAGKFILTITYVDTSNR